MSFRSPPHRLAAPLAVALAGGALILLLQVVPAVPPALEYRRAALVAEPWRLLTGHLVHLNWTHALVNAAAWPLLAWLFAPQLGARRQLAGMALSALFISLALAAWHPSIAWYRGASGALHALFFTGATAAAGTALRERSRPAALIALALLAGGWIKVALEQPGGDATPYADWLAATTVPQAHLFGAFAGTALGVRFAARSRRGPSLSR